MRPRLEHIAPGEDASFLWRHFRSRAFPFVWHLHPEIELTHIARGRGQRFVGDSIERFGEGELVLLGEDLPHTWSSDADCRRTETTVLQFRRDVLGQDFLERPELVRVRRLLAAARRGIIFHGKSRAEGIRRLERMGTLPPAQRLLEVLGILELLSRGRFTPLAGERFSVDAEAVGAERLVPVCRHISVNYRRRIPLHEAARLAHLSSSAFSRFFRRATGKSFTDYLIALRISRACQLLIETDAGVAEIALDSGFNNLSNFNRRFLALKGMNPRAFRREHARRG